ncbi:Xaa-Pro dipeptidase [Bacteroidia bacterium]|nr:Xaa-Pro dipeptidase [Bacteroidia bacterium]
MFTPKTYRRRREALVKLMAGEGGLVLLPANGEAPANYPDNCYRFRQDSTFLYFTGIDRPGYYALVDLDQGCETLLGDDPTMNDIIWTGPQPSTADHAMKAGIEQACPVAQLETLVARAVASGRRVHYLPPYRAGMTLKIAALLGIAPGAVHGGASVALALAVVALRSVKEPREVERIERACATGYRMHTTAMRMCRPGVGEREIMGAIEGIALQEGAGVAFPSIVSQHGETLHNLSCDDRLTEGRMLLVDAGAEEAMHYCCDFTRTTPVGGRFNTMQREIYDIVLGANDLGRRLAAPEMLYRDIHLAAATHIAEGLVALGLVKGDPREAVEAGAHALFMPHGLGHMMGLDVHEMENIGEKYVGYDRETARSERLGLASLRLGRRLQQGMTMTIEPGIYFIPALIQKWRAEGICRDFIDFDRVERYVGLGGIRIEDNILITAEGCRLLGERLPATVEQVEEMAGQ